MFFSSTPSINPKPVEMIGGQLFGSRGLGFRVLGFGGYVFITLNPKP